MKLQSIAVIAALWLLPFAAQAQRIKIDANLSSELFLACSGDSNKVLQEAQRLCSTLNSSAGRIGNAIGALGSILDRTSRLDPSKLTAAGLEQFANCFAQDPLLRALGNATGLFGNLVPDLNRLRENLPECGEMALNGILNELFGDIAGQMAAMGNCIGNVFGQFSGLISQTVGLAGQIFGYYNNYIRDFDQKLKNGLTRCGATGIEQLFNGCVKVGTGYLKPFEYAEKLAGIKLDPALLASEALSCAGTASGLGLPVGQLGSLIGEVVSTINSLKNISINIPGLGGGGAGGPGLCAALLTRASTANSGCAKVRAAARRAK